MSLVEIRKCLVIFSIPGRQGTRRFAYLPATEDWPEVMAGRKRVDESSTYHYYELVSTPHGLQFRSDRGGQAYRRALSDEGGGPYDG